MLLYIDSANRDSTDEINKFSVNTYNLHVSDNKHWQIAIKHLTLPLVYKQLDTPDNTFTYTFIQGVSNTTNTITIQPGNYNINRLLLQFKTLIEADVLTALGLTIDLNLVYDKDTYTCTFGFTNELLSTSVVINTCKSLEMCGFTGNASFNNTTTTQSDGIVNVNPTNAIYIRSNLTLDSYVNSNTQILNSNILVQIPLIFQSGTIMQMDSLGIVDIFDKNISNIKVWLTDQYNVLINQSLNWKLVLELKEVEDHIIDPTEKQPLDMNDIVQEHTKKQLNDYLEKQKKDIANNIDKLKQKKLAKIQR